MTASTRSNLALIFSLLTFVLAVVVFAFADGLRRWYSGLFFLLMAIVALLNAARWRSRADAPEDGAP